MNTAAHNPANPNVKPFRIYYVGKNMGAVLWG